MLNSIEEFLNEQEEAFSQCEDFMPRIGKIKEADRIGRKILNFIDDNIKNIDMDALDSIDVPKIVDDLNLDVNKELSGDVLSDIYKEIDENFRQGGKVSLEDYLNQGNIVLEDMLNELRGTVDYSIDYSEKQLKEAEEKAFERFNLVLSMHNLKETAFCFKFSPAAEAFFGKTNKYLDCLKDSIPYAGTIEEKIAEINTSVLLVASLESLDCQIIDKAELNNFFSDKVNNIMSDLSRYREDNSIRQMFAEMKQTIDKYSENEVINNLCQKIDKIDEKIFENIKDKTVDKSSVYE